MDRAEAQVTQWDLSDPVGLLEAYIQSNLVLIRDDPEKVPETCEHALDALKKLRAELDIKIIQTSRERNVNMCFVYQLPVELLIRILHLALPPPELPYGPAIQSLRSVSHRWMRVIDGVSRFWTLIHGRDGIPHLQQVLTKSVGVPLDVYWDHQDCITANMNQFFKKIEASSERWRSVTFRVGELTRELARKALENNPAQSLEELNLVLDTPINNQEWMMRPFNLFQALPARRLRKVAISKFPVVLPSPVLANLHHLSLHSVPTTPSKLLRILLESPDLQYLHLERIVRRTSDILSFDDGINRIHLPKLAKVEITTLNIDYIQYLLSRIDAPNCDAFQISTSLGSPIQFPIPGLAQFENALREGAWEISITLKGLPRGIHQVACEGVSCFSLEVGTERALVDCASWLTGLLGSSTSIPTILALESYNFSQPAFQAILPSLHRAADITDIIVAGNCLNAHKFFPSLAFRRVDPDGLGCPIWPNLKKIRVNHKNPALLSSIHEMLKGRAAARSQCRQRSEHPEHPLIQKIYFGERLAQIPLPDSDAMNELGNIHARVYPGMVYWYGTPVSQLYPRTGQQNNS
ncbi:hypothetical protein FRB90_008130 [Tulasnella sp. 427]|nr:hypothetical protein FRB90_008130 [Tulasnella sp. 427]